MKEDGINMMNDHLNTVMTKQIRVLLTSTVLFFISTLSIAQSVISDDETFLEINKFSHLDNDSER